MSHSKKLVVAATLSAGLFVFASCSNESKPPTTPPPPIESKSSVDASRVVGLEQGVAGGVVEDTFTATVTVSAMDAPARKITLTDDSGNKGTFTVGPEARNFDQIRVGDKVSATIKQRLEVFVRSGSEEPSVTHAAALARAPQGAKPGATIAESYEITASVKAIDTEKRTATLAFSGDETRTANIRPDVDLSKYKVGDTVVIRVTEALSLLVAKP